ncbi:hypothetical protein ABZ766_25320 [Streptomyces sp. NPDC006670]|uniref:hypothetical protein n=1 Tax=Streptomyces sp. NPDC006670 TaxID=3154476 RepID=UPI0033FD27AA
MSMPSSSEVQVPSGPVDPSRSNSAQPAGGGPKGSRRRKTIAIGAAALAGLLLAGYGVRQLASSDLPAATHRLTVPETMVDGTYQLSEDLSHSEKSDALARSISAVSRTTKVVNAKYASVSPEAPSVLTLAGLYGQFDNPANVRRSLLAGAAYGSTGGWAVRPRDITPAGSDTTLTCQASTFLGEKAVWRALPMCAWADGNTVAVVTLLTAEVREPTPENVDLDGLAALTLKVRAETRQPLA